ncbi:caspase-3-like [Ornithodoros turicata]|uniref:caspase-3-like n=1 Tax=Ornithodoros turicata TaxID=34597 RepID=UPI003138FE68
MATAGQMPDAKVKLKIRHDFHNRKQREGESISEFYNALMSLASSHGNIPDEAICSTFINGLRDERIAGRLDDMKGCGIDTFYKKAIELEAESHRGREMSQGIPATSEPSQVQQEASQDQALQHADARTAAGISKCPYNFGKGITVGQVEVPDVIKYKIGHERRSLCLILDCVEFPGKPELYRKGSYKDAHRIKEVFSGFGLKAEVIKDLNASEMKMELKKVATDRNRTDDDCFLCFVLSHGKRGEISTKDGSIKLQELVDPFMSEEAAHFRGKPKIFFVQACQYIGEDEKNAETPVEWSYDIASYPELYFGIATQPGFYSYRLETKGAPYIQTICNIFENSITSEDSSPDLETLMNAVHRCLSCEFETNFEGEGKYHEKKQAPCFFSTLTDKVVFSKCSQSSNLPGTSS